MPKNKRKDEINTETKDEAILMARSLFGNSCSIGVPFGIQGCRSVLREIRGRKEKKREEFGNTPQLRGARENSTRATKRKKSARKTQSTLSFPMSGRAPASSLSQSGAGRKKNDVESTREHGTAGDIL